MKRRQGILFRRKAESYDEAYFEGLSERAEEPDLLPCPQMIASFTTLGSDRT